ncbi:MAG: hypothetical protein HGA45_35195 [Chloroflexales bacterium]|nr:hypothetical protein [Chloroflexales bacterium]
MKALGRVRRALLLVLILATVTLDGGLLMVPLTLRPLTLLDRLLQLGLGAEALAPQWLRNALGNRAAALALRYGVSS